MENAEKGFFNLVFGEPAGKVLGLTDVELATRLADKDVGSEHKKEEIGSPSWIRTNNLAVNPPQADSLYVRGIL